MATFYEQMANTTEKKSIYSMLELGKDILELNIVNKFDTVLIQIT